MRRFFLLLAVLSLAALAGPAAGPVTGQAANNSTATDSPAAPATPETVAVEIDPTLSLAEFSYENGSWRLVFVADVPTRVKVTDSARAMAAWEAAEGKSAVDLRPRGYTLSSGRTVVTYSGTTFQGQAAITVATSRGVKFLATDGIQTGGPWSNTSPTAGWLGGVSVVGCMVGLAAYRAKNRDPGGPEDLE